MKITGFELKKSTNVNVEMSSLTLQIVGICRKTQLKVGENLKLYRQSLLWFVNDSAKTNVKLNSHRSMFLITYVFFFYRSPWSVWRQSLWELTRSRRLGLCVHYVLSDH